MEAVARQFATNKQCLVIRNGWFSYRWSQIFDMGGIPSETIVLKARPVSDGRQAPFMPAPVDEVVARSEEHTSELQSLMRNSYAVFCLKKTQEIPAAKPHTHTPHPPQLPPNTP